MKETFVKEHLIGYVSHVNPQYTAVCFPSSALLNKLSLAEGNGFDNLLLGSYLAIEGLKHGFIGKVMEIDLPERVSLGLTSDAYEGSDFRLSAKLEIMLSFEYEQNNKVSKGLLCYPSIGDKIYLCSEEFLKDYLKGFGIKEQNKNNYFHIGNLTSGHRTPVHVSLQSFFARHCAIVGTTGGGKSWTIAKLLEEMKLNGSKSILIDPTGEYEAIVDDHFTSVVLAENTFFHYRKLTIEDLFYLIKPSGKVQMPKLLEAIRSLKALELSKKRELAEYVQKGLLRKLNKKKANYETFYFENIEQIEDGLLNFDINFLSGQITQECIFDTDKNDPEKFGNRNDEDVSSCVNLISRTYNLLHTGIFKDVFGFQDDENSKNELTNVINGFLESDKSVLRISFEKVGFEYQAREILANAIGQFLLQKARKDVFKENPVVIFIDEAHQFLNKTVVDDYFQGSSLTAFDQIAKECRKFGLFVCLATQMPRDIPVGTLSQMGTFIVHRLINSYDKEAISHACSSATDNILGFLPVLGEGEAILTGVDFPMDITIKIGEPKLKPHSNTPKFHLRKQS